MPFASISLFSTIYSKATMTFVYLGEPTSKEQGDLALKLGRQIIDMTTKFKSGKCYIDGKMGGEVFQGIDVDIQKISLV